MLANAPKHRCQGGACLLSRVAIVPRRSAMATVLCCWTYCIPGMSLFNIHGFGNIMFVSCFELWATAGACPCWCVGCLCEMDACWLSKSIRQNVAATGVVQISPPLLRAAQARRQFGVCTVICGLLLWVYGSLQVSYGLHDVGRTTNEFMNREVMALIVHRESLEKDEQGEVHGRGTDVLYYVVVVAVGAAYCWFNCCARRTDDESLVLPTRAVNPVAGASFLPPSYPTLQQERLPVFIVTRGLTPWMMDGMRLMCSRRRTGGRSRPRKIALRGRPLGDRFGRTPNAGAPGDDDQCSSRAGRGSSAHAGRGSGARAAARAWARGPDGRKACVDLRLRVLRVTAPRRAHG